MLRPFAVDPLIDYAHRVATSYKQFGIDRHQVYRWRHSGGLDPFTADRMAVRMGAHPAEIWPNWFSEVSA